MRKGGHIARDCNMVEKVRKIEEDNEKTEQGFVEACRCSRISKSKKVNEIVFNYAKILRNISCKVLPKNKKFFLRKKGGNQLSINVLLKMKDTEQYVEAKALIDSGCTRCAIDREFVNKNHIKREKLQHKLKVLNVDGTENSSGRITHHTEVMMRMGSVHWGRNGFRDQQIGRS